ncbi:hypothetical protein HY639_00900 [Candidatus Woesearchaeota archaeon]|nr:hypothetical protein [Candidatus Woesearchaeota archaeon]
MKKELLAINSAPLLIILLVFFYNAEPPFLSAYAVKEMVQPTNTVSIANGIDVNNADQGTLTITLAMPLDRVQQGKAVDKIVLFESKFIDGLRLAYDVRNGFLEGGVPSYESAKVTLFDGNTHRIVYSYDRSRDGQMMSVDDTVVAMGRYTGQKSNGNSLTAAFIGLRTEPYLLEGATAAFDALSRIP